MLLCGSFACAFRAADRGCDASTRPSLRPLGSERVARPGDTRAKRAARMRRHVCNHTFAVIVRPVRNCARGPDDPLFQRLVAIESRGRSGLDSPRAWRMTLVLGDAAVAALAMTLSGEHAPHSPRVANTSGFAATMLWSVNCRSWLNIRHSIQPAPMDLTGAIRFNGRN